MTRRLLIRPGAIGDFIVSLPALEFLRRGADYLEVWCAAPNVPLVRFADHAAAISSTGLDWLGLPEIDPPAPVMRALGSFDDIVSWYGANRPEFRQAVSGLPFRFLPALPSGAGTHAAEFYLAQVNGQGPAIPSLPCPATPADFAVIQPFSGSRRKNWPLDHYRHLACRLETRLPVRWCAGPEEDLTGAVRIDNLYELATWIAGARLYVGNDSGITHLAAAAGTAVVAVFTATDPAVWAPRGRCIRVVTNPSPEAVEAACLDTLRGAVCPPFNRSM